MTITTFCDDGEVEQITKQLHKLINVLKVTDLCDSNHVEREIMLVKIQAVTRDIRDEVKTISDIFHGQIVDLTPTIYTVEIIGSSEELDTFLETVTKVTEIVEEPVREKLADRPDLIVSPFGVKENPNREKLNDDQYYENISLFDLEDK